MGDSVGRRRGRRRRPRHLIAAVIPAPFSCRIQQQGKIREGKRNQLPVTSRDDSPAAADNWRMQPISCPRWPLKSQSASEEKQTDGRVCVWRITRTICRFLRDQTLMSRPGNQNENSSQKTLQKVSRWPSVRCIFSPRHRVTRGYENSRINGRDVDNDRVAVPPYYSFKSYNGWTDSSCLLALPVPRHCHTIVSRTTT